MNSCRPDHVFLTSFPAGTAAPLLSPQQARKTTSPRTGKMIPGELVVLPAPELFNFNHARSTAVLLIRKELNHSTGTANRVMNASARAISRKKIFCNGAFAKENAIRHCSM